MIPAHSSRRASSCSRAVQIFLTLAGGTWRLLWAEKRRGILVLPLLCGDLERRARRSDLLDCEREWEVEEMSRWPYNSSLTSELGLRCEWGGNCLVRLKIGFRGHSPKVGYVDNARARWDCHIGCRRVTHMLSCEAGHKSHLAWGCAGCEWTGVSRRRANVGIRRSAAESMYTGVRRCIVALVRYTERGTSHWRM
ncbi:hypothetical protein PENSPDRAFT_49066 [Peniophora sp. CONT]|nr:hypothetical protein PENSPDRAFT_49066 [Peniophora sp. CONT]